MEDYKSVNANLAVKPDRTLAIVVKPVLVWKSWNKPYDIEATFTCTLSANGTVPAMNANRVAANGDIDFYPLPDPQHYNDNVDVTLTLDTSALVDHSGTHAVRGRFATSSEYSGTGPVTGFGWFCAIQNVPRRQYDKTPIQVANMTFIRQSDTQLLIDDDTPGTSSVSYAYCMGLVLPDYDNYYITLDPVVGGKGPSSV